MCDSLLFIDSGRIVHHGSAESLQEMASTVLAVVDIQVAANSEALRQWVELHPGVKILELRKRGARVSVEDDEPEFLAAMLKRMILDGVAVTEFHREERKLEDAFIEMLKKIEPSGATPPPLPTS